MMLSTLLLAAAPAVSAPAGDLLAIRARHLATGTGETLEHAVVLVEDGRIVTVGEDLPIERGILVLDSSRRSLGPTRTRRRLLALRPVRVGILRPPSVHPGR